MIVHMARSKKNINESQLEINFMDNDSVTDVSRASVHARVLRRVQELPILPKGKDLGFFEQVDMMLQQIGKSKMNAGTRVNAFILRSFYAKGKGVSEISKLLSGGVKGTPCVCRERVRMIVQEIREDFLSMRFTKKLTQGIVLRKDFVDKMTEFTDNHIGYVIKESKWLTCPRLDAIAFILRKKVIVGETIIPCVKTERILIDEDIEKSVFCAHYAGLFHLLQREVRPMSFDAIMHSITNQIHMKGIALREELIRFLLLQHDKVFEQIEEGIFQLRAEYMKGNQRIARIIYEKKDISSVELQRLYTELHGEKCSSISAASRVYSWCVPLGKSKWVYREDGERMRLPADFIRDFCKEHVRFTMQDVLDYLVSQGVNIKESSVRCYILRDCRPLNSDGNTFCLTSAIPKSKDHLWRSKNTATTRPHHNNWKTGIEVEIHRILESAPMQRMLQRDVLKQCMQMLESKGVAYNNFYKVVYSATTLRTIKIDGKIYIELND